jgi:hypothetical protein
MTNWWTDGPGNKRDRARFAALNSSTQIAVNQRARLLYDGSRTVARCWSEALDYHTK